MTGVQTWDTNAANNVQANIGYTWDEGMAPAAVNNSARAVLADVRSMANDLIWFQYGKGAGPYTPVYVGATQYKIAGVDVTAAYHVGRRTKVIGSSTGTIVGTISAVAFSTDTTVTVTWDSGSLSNEAFTAVYLLQIPATNVQVGTGKIVCASALQNYLTGLTLSTAGSSATFSVAAGEAMDSTNVALMILAASISKTTSSWAVGSGNGGLDTGAIATSTWYHVWLIQRPDTGVVDVLISTSASSPTMPTNYTLKRRIGSMKTNGSAQWTKFSQLGDEFYWDTFVEDASSVTPGVTTATTVTLTVPTGVQVGALFSALISDTGSPNINISPLDVLDQASSGSGAFSFYANGTGGCSMPPVRTNTSAQVRLRVGATTTTYWLNTRGWTDPRGK